MASRAKVIVNASMPSTFETMSLAGAFDRIVVDGIAVVTPFFIACTHDVLIRHIFKVADAVETPVYMYNIPAHTQNHIEPEPAATFVDHGNIADIKDSLAVFSRRRRPISWNVKDKPGFEVLSRPDYLVLWFAAQRRCALHFPVTAIAMPGVLAGIVDAFNAGNIAKRRSDRRALRHFRIGHNKTRLRAGHGEAGAVFAGALRLALGESQHYCQMTNGTRRSVPLLQKHEIVLESICCHTRPAPSRHRQRVRSLSFRCRRRGRAVAIAISSASSTAAEETARGKVVSEALRLFLVVEVELNQDGRAGRTRRDVG